jgi:hypothetical protein
VDRAELLEQQAARTTPDAAELAARRGAIGSMSLEVLEERWAKLGKPNEVRVEGEHQRQVEARKKAGEHVTTLQQTSALAEQAVMNAEQQVQQATQLAQSAQAVIGDAKPEELGRAIDLELVQSGERAASVKSAISALDAERNERRARGKQAVEAARSALEVKKQARVSAQQSADAARESLNRKQGELGGREEQFARLDRRAAADQVGLAEAALAALPGSPLATQADVDRAADELAGVERELSEAAEEFFKAEGALTKVGGAQLREQLSEAQDGLKAARAREREVETDALAWKLLREKLKAAEDGEAAHLGRALGEPVGKRFAELTGGRYSKLEFDPLLSASGLEVAGVSGSDDVISALSIGTRDQLATLVRLTIANQLKSAIVLDDHLVQTDLTRLAWFREMLLKTALNTQVVVFTCRALDYLHPDEMLNSEVSLNLAAGSIRAIRLSGVVQRW